MSRKVYVLGVGPGSPDYVLPIVEKKARECSVLVGGGRNLELFRDVGKREIVIKRDISAVVNEIQEIYRVEQVGVLVSGDPGFYSFLQTLLRYFEPGELEVYPGISSLQYLFAKGVLPWQDACFVSLHGRRVADLVRTVKEENKVAFLTDAKMGVGQVCRLLTENGVKDRRVLVGENLSYSDEKVFNATLEECAGIKTRGLCVMVVYDDSGVR